MSWLHDHAWVILALPLISFVVIGVGLRQHKLAGLFGTCTIGFTGLLALLLGLNYLQSGQGVDVAWQVLWLEYDPTMKVNLGLLLDPISVLLLAVVSVVSTLVHIYSLGYMKGDPGVGRYFAYLSLFTFSMFGLVVAPNIMQMFVFWELVGASSFLLIGFYYKTEDARAASKKAFIVTRFADLFFLIGILILGFMGFHILESERASIAQLVGQSPFDFSFITSQAVLERMSAWSWEGMSLLTVALVLIFIGGAGKSGMFPLHVWLPDAMAGPTPVSALIHAATMVVAGVYLVARLFPAFAASGDALHLVAAVGAVTCLFAATIACTQNDIKRVLAYSTLSQLGYMMFALGVASAEHLDGRGASMFHLFTHAFFKALLFLGAGSVIHAVHTNDIGQMGGLRKKMPITHITFLIATLAIAGVPPLAGFFSKDAILLAAIDGGHSVVFAVGLLVAGLTAFYMFRLYLLTFHGQGRGEGVDHAHEASASMTVPLCILAFLSLVAGFVPVDSFVMQSSGEAHHSDNHTWVAMVSVLVGLTGIGTAWFMYSKGLERGQAMAKRTGILYIVVKNKFYIDEIYLYVTKQIIFKYIAAPIAWFDRHVVDGAMNLTSWMTCQVGSVVNRLQTGQVQTYGIWVVNGTVLVVLFIYFVANSAT